MFTCSYTCKTLFESSLLSLFYLNYLSVFIVLCIFIFELKLICSYMNWLTFIYITIFNYGSYNLYETFGDFIVVGKNETNLILLLKQLHILIIMKTINSLLFLFILFYWSIRLAFIQNLNQGAFHIKIHCYNSFLLLR